MCDGDVVVPQSSRARQKRKNGDNGDAGKVGDDSSPRLNETTGEATVKTAASSPPTTAGSPTSEATITAALRAAALKVQNPLCGAGTQGGPL